MSLPSWADNMAQTINWVFIHQMPIQRPKTKAILLLFSILLLFVVLIMAVFEMFAL